MKRNLDIDLFDSDSRVHIGLNPIPRRAISPRRAHQPSPQATISPFLTLSSSSVSFCLSSRARLLRGYLTPSASQGARQFYDA